MPMYSRPLVGVALLAASALAATPSHQEAPDELASLVRDNRYVFTGTRTQPGGAGFEFLVREAAKAEFLLVGEAHQTAEIPVLVRQLAEELRPAGYGALAIEIGPQSAAWVTERLQSHGLNGLRAVVSRYPQTLPLYEGRAEAQLLDSVLRQGYEVWGLDQEFLGSGRYFLDRLAALAPDAAAAEQVAQLKEIDAAGVAHYQANGEPDGLVFLAAAPARFEEAAAAFDGVEEAERILQAMAASARIYQLWSTDNYESNRLRVRALKSNLISRLQAWEEAGRRPPKVIVKLGSFHTGRGRSRADQYDVGTLTAQLAERRGGASLHVVVTALGMRAADGTFSPWRSTEPGWQALYEAVAPDAPWTIIDLRALRPYFHQPEHQTDNSWLVRTVFQHDLVVFAPEFHPAEPLVPEGR